MIQRGSVGADTILAAKVIYKAVNNNSNKLRYTVDKTSKRLIFFRSISTLPLFQFIIRKFVK
jgi:hypothetical protein